jgi:hypothetical protein
MRCSAVVLCLASLPLGAEEPKLVVKPDAFPTLVNPNCSHCVDEAKRRKDELKDSDRVLVWTRGKYDGGAIPFRFFLNQYRVISDTYGVFVHDPEAGYARGFKASVDFTFHGWRNGVMVMKHKDGTLFSCLSGFAFEGPRKGQRLESWPTLTTDWGWVMKNYPSIVAYHMFDKYKPIDVPARPKEESLKSRGKADARLPAEEIVLGVEAPSIRARPRAYRVADLEKRGKFAAFTDTFEWGTQMVILWQDSTRTAAAYRPAAVKYRATTKLSEVGDVIDTKEVLQLEADGKSESAPFVDKTTGSRFDIEGRCLEGKLKGYCLQTQDSVMVKWFAWSAEYGNSTVFQPAKAESAPKAEPKKEPRAKADDAIREVAGAAEFLRAVPKKFARFQGVDAKTGRVKLLVEGEKEATEWPVEADAEIKVMGWWGRLEQMSTGHRVWVWFKTDRKKRPVSVLMLADEISEQDMHGDGLHVTGQFKGSIFAKRPKGAEFAVFCTPATKRYRGKNLEATDECPKEGSRVFVQTDGEKNGLLVLDAEAFDARRAQQKDWLREKWLKEGLPGTVAFAHVSGEADLMLDHEAMRWARSLKTGDKVKLKADPPIAAVVKSVAAWRERTQIRVVIAGVDLAGLAAGQRIDLQMQAPAAEVATSAYPPDIDRLRTKDERIDWFLANTYCTCKVGGDTCTGHFYTLASCNPNACATPNATRKKIADKIDSGLSNRQIFDELKNEKGATLLKPHLAP